MVEAMKARLLTVAAAAALLGLTACSTPATRIQRNPAAFAALPSADQPLVQRGIVREGMSHDAVFLAWGQPDFVRRMVRPKLKAETWIYVGTDFVPVPGFRYDYLPGGYGRYGRHRVPVYDWDYVPVRRFDRSATFENGRVIGWEAPTR
jgi:hypothetical protein